MTCFADQPEPDSCPHEISQDSLDDVMRAFIVGVRIGHPANEGNRLSAGQSIGTGDFVPCARCGTRVLVELTLDVEKSSPCSAGLEQGL